MGHHKEEHEEHMDETWLIPYADLLTLLLALFIVLFASSNLDQKKFGGITKSLKVALGGGDGIFPDPSPVVVISDISDPIYSVTTPVPPESKNGTGSKNEKTTPKLLLGNRSIRPPIGRVIRWSQLEDQLKSTFETGALATHFTLRYVKNGLVISISDTALFDPGSDQIKPNKRPFIHDISQILARYPTQVTISGYTDDRPIHTAAFPTNWHLSSSRAVNTLTAILNQNPHLDPARFSAIGYGRYRPIATNDTESGRRQNRRVEIFIQRQPDSRLFYQIFSQQKE